MMGYMCDGNDTREDAEGLGRNDLGGDWDEGLVGGEGDEAGTGLCSHHGRNNRGGSDLSRWVAPENYRP